MEKFTVEQYVALFFLGVLGLIIAKILGIKSKWFSFQETERKSHIGCPLYSDIGVIVGLSKQVTQRIAKKWYKTKIYKQMMAIEGQLSLSYNMFKKLTRKTTFTYQQKKFLIMSLKIIDNKVKNSLKVIVYNNSFPDGDRWNEYKRTHIRIITAEAYTRFIDECEKYFNTDEANLVENDLIKPYIDNLKLQIDEAFNRVKNISTETLKEITELQDDFKDQFYEIVHKKPKDGGKKQ
jgi:hypothetical protein